MKLKYCFGIFFLALTGMARSQSLTLSGNVNASNLITFASATAGDIPIAMFSLVPAPPLVVSSTLQSLKYSWKFGGLPDDPNSYIMGSIMVNASVAIPSGLEWTIQAAAPSQARYGSSTGEQILTTSNKDLINGIWSTGYWFWPPWQVITNQLTHRIKLVSFQDLHPTAGASGLTVRLTYTLQ